MSEIILTAAISGLGAEIIQVEATSAGGEFGQIAIVGLPDVAISEARERVKSALVNCGLPYPKRKLTVNLAPAHLKKRGSGYDLPIAVCILCLSNRFKFDFERSIFCGELSLDGEVRPLRSVLPFILAAKRAGLKTAYLAVSNAAEAALVPGIEIIPVINLKQTIAKLKGEINIPAFKPETTPVLMKSVNPWSHIKGQTQAKRALTIAAAGGHNLLMIGPPGSGKSLLANSLAALLPDLSPQRQLEVAQIYSVAGEFDRVAKQLHRPPFRAPHHNASLASILGGGRGPKPGEITLAHRGALFLDELPEFSRVIIDALRQPIEQGQILISRADNHLHFPADFLLLAAMNPCPCGYDGDDGRACTCSQTSIQRYRQRISGPILDRFDLQLNVPRLLPSELSSIAGDAQAPPLLAVESATKKQLRRQSHLNARAPSVVLRFWQKDNKEAESLALQAADSLKLSARAYDRLFKVARTIADLDSENNILPRHIAEALSYRLDNK
ncbi:MAG: YifB family Mg chelatase-like AAA ATPase [bacterium]|nr:YifB family Mg chelatase-like AAA ATPase [bacterium]